VYIHKTSSNFLNDISNHQNISTNEFTDSSFVKQTERKNSSKYENLLKR